MDRCETTEAYGPSPPQRAPNVAPTWGIEDTRTVAHQSAQTRSPHTAQKNPPTNWETYSSQVQFIPNSGSVPPPPNSFDSSGLAFGNRFVPGSSSFGAGHTNTEKILKGAWRTKGYPAFATFMGSSDDTFAVRRFAKLHARSILLLQNEIVVLERQLRDMDEKIYQNESDPEKANQSSLLNDKKHHPVRITLLWQLTSMLERYDKMVLRYSMLKSRPKAQKSTIRNLQGWLHNNEHAIEKSEAEFFTEKGDDLIELVPGAKSMLRRVFERLPTFKQWFRYREPRPGNYDFEYEPDGVIYFSNGCIEIFTFVIIMGMGLGMLLGPAWWLQKASSPDTRLFIISAFVPLFAVLLLLALPTPKPFETLAATAAYAAVLMVFMQLGVADSET
ncbi:hypothetical protein BDY21DRAFT_424661 [Lineolata rhizophorae]|uniref:DUF6594 domain-containing protein n=1 Tax=Lineolata rhizophorae TaxID=578093 RepID=A0A6A6NNB1_9PEZI|nr:hypothetical protein BDY21DRAFT_424661 [Lineolata rhizophorae]